MCSWCYAFGPQLDRIVEESQLPVRLVMGGLYVGRRALPLDADLRRYLSETWTRVADMSGRPVARNLLEWDSWTYDTELACRAVVAAREAHPDLALEFFDRVQRAFYAENIDTTDPEVLAELGSDFGLDASTLLSDELASATLADFEEAGQMDAHGFPTLLLHTGTELITVAAGYLKADHVLRSIKMFVG
jgi:putative protein-disulfide isomerase